MIAFSIYVFYYGVGNAFTLSKFPRMVSIENIPALFLSYGISSTATPLIAGKVPPIIADEKIKRDIFYLVN